MNVVQFWRMYDQRVFVDIRWICNFDNVYPHWNAEPNRTIIHCITWALGSGMEVVSHLVPYGHALCNMREAMGSSIHCLPLESLLVSRHDLLCSDISVFFTSYTIWFRELSILFLNTIIMSIWRVKIGIQIEMEKTLWKIRTLALN